MKSGRKQILVLRFRFIGDTILTIPFLRNLRRAEPEAHITWMIAPGDAEIVRGIPYVDELLVWDPAKGNPAGPHRSLGGKFNFVRGLRRRHFDQAYVLKRSLASAVLARLSGAPRRVGFDTEHRGALLTTKVPYRHDRHEVQNFLDVLRADGMAVTDDHLEVWLDDTDRAFATDFLTKHGVQPGEKMVGLHPFAANKPRAWHEDDFAAVANAVQTKYGARILIFGGPGDRDLAAKLQRAISPAPVMAVGETTVRQSMALVARCALLVCNDSGVMHVGAALNIPLVALFGPQSPKKFGPWSQNCRVIYHKFPCSPCRQKFFTQCEPSARGKPACMEAITVSEVLAAVDSFAPELRPVV